MTRPIHSTPSELVLAWAMPFQEWVMVAGRVCLIPCQPPTLRSPNPDQREEAGDDEEELEDLVIDGRGKAAEEDVSKHDDG